MSTPKIKLNLKQLVEMSLKQIFHKLSIANFP